MATRIRNLLNNNPSQQSDNAMSQLYAPPYWINEQKISESFPESFSLKVDSVPQVCHKARSLSFRIQDQDSSSTQSTHSDHDLAVTVGNTSQDQSNSSESGQEVGGGKGVEGHVKPLLLGQANAAYNPTSQICFSHSTTCMPYADTEPFFNGILNAYGTASFIQPQMVGMQPTRVPLPLDITEDEPIYVNAKQYHGILRRRQSRAKLEAQNKLIKVRKPYLHESRHLHALNRVRGSGGRFLSTKKKQRSASSCAAEIHPPPNSAASQKVGNRSGLEQYQSLGMETSSPLRSSFQLSSLSGRSSIFQQPDDRFLGATRGGGAAMAGSGGFMNNQNRHHASVVQ